MMKQDIPKNASEWSEFLLTKSLSTGSVIGQQVLNSIQEKNLPFKTIAAQINQDPVFSYYIMSEANRSKDDSAPFSKTLDHAISMIGIDKLEKITKNLPFKETKTGNIQQFYYARAISSSLFAAYLARKISAMKHQEQKNDIYWGALFCGVPLWYLWHFATPTMRMVRHEIHTGQKSPEQAERDILGCSVPELAKQLMEKLNVPPLAKECYSPDTQLTAKQWIKISRHVGPDGQPKKVDDKAINHISSRASFTISLSNLLAYYASHDWYSRSMLRVQKVLSVYLGIPLHQAITLTHECAVDMSRGHPIPGVMLPAAKLILPPRQKISTDSQVAMTATTKKAETIKTSNIKIKTDSTTNTTPIAPKPSTKGNVEFTGEKIAARNSIKPEKIGTAPPPPQIKTAQPPIIESPTSNRGDKETFTEFTDIMLNNPDNFVDLHELMNAATQCIAYGLGLQRAIVALVNTTETRLKTYYNVGTRDYPELSSYQADLTKPSLFSRLVSKPASIWVKPSSSANIWALIPPEFKSASGAKEFFLMSIFVNQKPVAVFYADSGSDKEPLNEHDYKQFKYMCSAATQCLQYLATKRTNSK